MPSFPPPRCDQRAGTDRKGLDQLIEPLDPSHLKSDTAAQEAFDNVLLAKLSEKRNQLDNIRSLRKKELAQLRKKRPMPTRSLVFDPTTYTSMHDMMQVFTGSSRYIVKEVGRLVPEAKYSAKKKWFLGIRLIPLTDEDRADYENAANKRQKRSSGESADETSSEGSSDEDEDADKPVRSRRSSTLANKAIADADNDDERSNSSEDEDDDEDDDPDCDVARKRRRSRAASARSRRLSKIVVKKEREDSPDPPKKSRRKSGAPKAISPPPAPESPATEASHPAAESDAATVSASQISNDAGPSSFSFDSPRSPPSAPSCPSPFDAMNGRSPGSADWTNDKKFKSFSRYLMSSGPIAELASKGQLRTPNRRVGLAGKLQTEFGSPIVSPNMAPPMAIVEQQILKRELEMQRQLSQARAEKAAAEAGRSPDSPQGARVKRPSRPPGSGSGGDTSASEEMRSPGRASSKRTRSSPDGAVTAISRRKAIAITKVDDSSTVDDRIKSRRELEEKLESRRSSGGGHVVEHTAIPVAETKPKKKHGPRQKKLPDPMEAVESDKRPKRDLVFEQGATTSIIKIRDMFYPGRNTPMITKAVKVRVPGCSYDTITKKFINVAIRDTS